MIMAVQAQLFPENMGFPLPVSDLQDWTVNSAPAIPSFETDSCFDPRQNFPFHLQHNTQNLASAIAAASSSTCDSFLPLSQGLDAQLELQRQELDCILQMQNERLRSALLEQGKRQMAILLKSMESKAMHLMRRKEEDLAWATNRKMELEACLRKVELESESWQRLAKANQAMVMDLSNTLERVRESLIHRAEDAESLFCGSCDREQAEGEVIEESKKIKLACKHCNSRSSCVLFLPCRHLCSCKSCEAFLDSCPVCKSVKEASMKVFWV